MFDIYQGVHLDDRSEEAKQQDYDIREVVATTAKPNWAEKKQSEWRKFPIYNQDGSGSCVAQTLAKMKGIKYWLLNKIYIHFSATHIYQRRRNKPGSGMHGYDALDICTKGVTLEELVPSQNMTDKQMDAIEIPEYKVEVGNIFKSDNYVVLPTNDIDIVASTIEATGKGVMVWFYFGNNGEWTDVPTIKDDNLNISSANRHSVTAVDYTLYEGEKALIIEDSWGKTYGLGGQRVIKESFYKKRNFFAGYLKEFVFETAPEEEEKKEEPVPKPDKPKYTVTKQLEFKPSFVVEEDVKVLQNVLKYEGVFPKNVDSTGWYGPITAKAVDKFQRKHNVAPVAELDALRGKRVGPKTTAKLTELYG